MYRQTNYLNITKRFKNKIKQCAVIITTEVNKKYRLRKYGEFS